MPLLQISNTISNTQIPSISPFPSLSNSIYLSLSFTLMLSVPLSFSIPRPLFINYQLSDHKKEQNTFMLSIALNNSSTPQGITPSAVT
jgi:hypothetical protein